LERRAQKAAWTKLGLQMATGSGKTKVMSLLMVWAHLHWQLGDHNDALGFGGTQLLLAPNLIVLERLLTDFAPTDKARCGNIFQTDPLLPSELRSEFNLRVVTPDNVPVEWQPSEGYLIVSNIHKLYPPENPAEPAESLTPELELFDPLRAAT